MSGWEADAARIETTGLLYGVGKGSTVRLHSVQAGREPIRTYVLRVRGEVLLTERNVELFERTGALLALVVSGGRAGFFVRDFDGALQSIRSYQEFDAPHLLVGRRNAALAAGLFCLGGNPFGCAGLSQLCEETRCGRESS
jgi:hypothetical protein